ncbi:T9SS type A sorting domain-containing protein [Gelidibacter japonicus]|uniref:LamG-like jellyroll fold domain-containing protein n=1 Tax=Gelidibacter japonicus TaxID=1962232 RepID=UPI00202268D3|nr:LamG-like jellyroll fold domain-containing protein [Gelidibacter japonicus]MCL8008874.1 T9SS type A sorting domain-containing protein [Gelidibacter japonicus]
MKKNYTYLLSFILLSLFVGLSYGQSSESKHAGKGENITKNDWTNPENITAENSYATIKLKGTSEYLKGTNYGFDIPKCATIDGIELIINRAQKSSGNGNIQDAQVKLVKGKNTFSENLAKSGNWPTSQNETTYGSNTEVWGINWTPDDINDANFGAVLSVKTTGNGNKDASVDYMMIKVYFTVPDTTADAGSDIDYSGDNCGIVSVNLNAQNSRGEWSVISGQPRTSYSFGNKNDPKSTFTGQLDETYILQWQRFNPSPCSDTTDTMTVTFAKCGDFFDFNGKESYVNFGNEFNFWGEFSIELWIKPTMSAAPNQTLLSKRGSNIVSGYDLSLSNGKLSFNWNSFGSLESPYPLFNTRWYHVAVTYSNWKYRLYIDGIQVAEEWGFFPLNNSSDAILGATRNSSDLIQDFYNGSMDEVRIWNKALTEDHIRQMMNQEIEKSGTAVRGSVLGLEVSNLKWNDLEGYYRMNQGIDIAAGKLADNSGLGTIGILNGMKTMQLESAPLPYTTTEDGEWNLAKTWKDGSVQQTPNSIGIDGKTLVDWNIVKIGHNVTATGKNIKVAGLLVEGKRLTIRNHDITDGHSLEVSEYLNINEGAVLELVGESQLIQGKNSVLGTGTGILMRDQQGTGNMFNYNYWGSPVSTAGSADSRTFSVAGVLHDGDLPVLWTANNNGSPTSPAVTLSTRWLYTYNGNADNYNVWKRINQKTELPVGLGFLMKGAGAYNAADKNYTFKGQPNNGTIQIAVGGPKHAVVVGNPYPSAIDANQFFDDNANVLKPGSALQFWEQSPEGKTHVFAAYQGRYSYYVKTGSVAAARPPVGSSAPSGIAGAGRASKTPGRYIPVGQGFYVEINDKGGKIEFNNGQRKFVKEEVGESVFLRTPESGSDKVQKRTATNADAIQRVRLEFTTPEGAARSLLLGFTPDDSATDGIDYGYDGLNSDDFPSDLSFAIEDKKFVIQGVGAFDINKKYPLDMSLKIDGNVALALTGLENFDAPIDVFVYDSELDTYTQINDSNFQMSMQAGQYKDRFSIVFRKDSTLSTIDQEFKEIGVKYLQKTAEIYVSTPESSNVRQVSLINMVGQTVRTWNISDTQYSREFKIAVKDIAAGNYIIQVELSNNSYNKKVVIQ